MVFIIMTLGWTEDIDYLSNIYPDIFTSQTEELTGLMLIEEDIRVFLT